LIRRAGVFKLTLPQRGLMSPNNALVSDACAAARRAFCSAPQRER
jgi:hypothetical protein